MAKLIDEGGGIYSFICPACKDIHYMHTKSKNADGAQWTFSGNMDSPTFKPSINYRTGMYAKNFADNEHKQFLIREKLGTICHFILTNGVAAYCGDSTHPHRSKSLPLNDVDA